MDVVFWHVSVALGLLYVLKKKWYRKVKRMTAQKNYIFKGKDQSLVL